MKGRIPVLLVAVAALSGVVVLNCSCASDGPPGRGLGDVFRRGTWKLGGTTQHPLLSDGAEIATWDLTGYVEPVPHVRVVRADGRDHAIESPDDLRPFVRPIDTPEQAVEYGWLLRSFEIDQKFVPGFGREFLRHDFDARVRSAGIDPGPEATPDGAGGFEVRRVVVADARRLGLPAAAGQYAVRDVRERIGRDGTYAVTSDDAPATPVDAVPLLSLPK